MTTRAYAADTRAGEPLLTVRDLSVTFLRQGEKPFTAVDGVSFDVRPGQTVGLVGESGSGKSVTSLAIMGLLPARGNQVTGTATFDGTDLLALDNNAMRDRRGRDLGMIFQDPLSSLNPVVPIGIQVTEVLERHKGMSRKAWEAEREDRIAGKSGKISVTYDEPDISISGDKATVKFRQHYKATGLKTSTSKVVVFVRAGGKWLIREEISR